MANRFKLVSACAIIAAALAPVAAAASPAAAAAWGEARAIYDASQTNPARAARMAQSKSLEERLGCSVAWARWEAARNAGEFAPASLAALGPKLAEEESLADLWFFDFQVMVETSAMDVSEAQADRWEQHLKKIENEMGADINSGNRGNVAAAQRAVTRLAACAI